MLKGAGTARVALDRMARVFIEPLKCFKKQTEWYRYGTIGDNTLADAILDRLVHNSHRLELGGESMRRTKEKQVVETEENGGNS